MPNPKRPTRSAGGRQSWYPFYPGFGHEFASWILTALRDSDPMTLLDPWNGSGTTTALAAQRGLSAVGVDLNPAMVVIARAKLLDSLDVDSIRPLRRQILKLATPQRSAESAQDEPLLQLFAHEGAPTLRALEWSVRRLLVDCTIESEHSATLLASRMSPLAAFFYVALFRVSRNLLREFGTTNPVWTKLNVPGAQKPRPSRLHIREMFTEEVEAMLACESDGRPLSRANSPSVVVNVGNATQLCVPEASVGLTLSSPPYCTRVDYAVAMLPELSILGLKRGSSFDDLRRQLTGTTTVPKTCDTIDSSWGPTCTNFLRAVERHSSKASASYYLKSHVRYFFDLARSIHELRRVATPGGKAVLVVQDSHYKEIHNDLPAITVEMAESVGFRHVASRHFPLTRLLAASNPKVRKYRTDNIKATESVVVLQA